MTAGLLDDFRDAPGVSALGTRWRAFTDRVMGGRSTGDLEYVDSDRGRVLRLRGRISLEDNGGFIQAALPLAGDGETFDAGAWRGLRLVARANAERGFWLHLRTADTRLPWQHYVAPLEIRGAGWQEVSVRFAAFEPRGLRAPLDPGRLTRVGIVAGKLAFEAEIDVAELSLVR